MMNVCLIFFATVLGISGVWWALTRFRNAKYYMLIWAPIVLLLTAWWGSALAYSIHMHWIHTYGGQPDPTYEVLGADILFLISVPALLLDIVFLLRWPKKAG